MVLIGDQFKKEEKILIGNERGDLSVFHIKDDPIEQQMANLRFFRHPRFGKASAE